MTRRLGLALAGFAGVISRRGCCGGRWREFAEDQCSQHAASIAYHVLFSLFPLAIVLAGASSLVLHATGSRADVVDTIVRNLPLSASGARDIRGLLLGATSSTAGLGLIAIVGLVYSASGMMTALRTALNQAWDVQQPRPFLKGKLIDLGLVFAVATLGLGSLALTIAARFLSAHAALPASASWAASVLGPLVLAFGVSLFLYRVIPAAEVRLRDTWPAALIIAALLVVLQNLFALYVGNFAHYNAIYGSLGAVIAFMFFVYLAGRAVPARRRDRQRMAQGSARARARRHAAGPGAAREPDQGRAARTVGARR